MAPDDLQALVQIEALRLLKDGLPIQLQQVGPRLAELDHHLHLDHTPNVLAVFLQEVSRAYIEGLLLRN